MVLTNWTGPEMSSLLRLTTPSVLTGCSDGLVGLVGLAGLAGFSILELLAGLRGPGCMY